MSEILSVEKYAVGSTVQGKVRNLTDFGAFVEIEEGVDGLVHVSDMSWTKRIKHPSEVLKKGDDVAAVITSIDQENRRSHGNDLIMVREISRCSSVRSARKGVA